MPRPVYGEVRIEDVARRAGVSRATVSRVLGGAPGTSAHVAPDTAARVQRAADELGYLINPVARALASGRGFRVVVAVIGATPAALDDPYLGRFIASAARVVDPHGIGMGLQWVPLDTPAPLDAVAADRSVLGVVLINTTEAVLNAIPARLRGRVVSVGIGAADVASVDVDNATPVTMVVQHLLDSGRRNIAMVTGPPWLPCCRRPLHAYRRTMEEAGRPVRMTAGDFTSDHGRRATAELLHRWPDTDAIHAICDGTALGVLAVLAERGIHVPGDIAVTGFDDIPYASLSGLTTATHPVERIAEAAVQTVLDAPSASTARIRFGSQLVLRHTA
jgi:DNA-binding LacI/PurR family transcriptional regulator